MQVIDEVKSKTNNEILQWVGELLNNKCSKCAYSESREIYSCGNVKCIEGIKEYLLSVK